MPDGSAPETGDSIYICLRAVRRAGEGKANDNGDYRGAGRRNNAGGDKKEREVREKINRGGDLRERSVEEHHGNRGIPLAGQCARQMD